MSCILVQADVRIKLDVQKLCDETIKAFGKIDIVINNAGISSDSSIQTMDDVIGGNLTRTSDYLSLCWRFEAKKTIQSAC